MDEVAEIWLYTNYDGGSARKLRLMSRMTGDRTRVEIIKKLLQYKDREKRKRAKTLRKRKKEWFAMGWLRSSR